MGVSLERVQNKFACIIGELCSEPFILSQFAVWVDLRIAEYKTNGTISLDCSGDSPNPPWMKGVKTHPKRSGLNSVDTGQGVHHRQGSFTTSPAASPVSNQLYDDRLQPPQSPRLSHNSGSQQNFPDRLSPDILVIKEEPGSDQLSSCTLGRKRHSDGGDQQSDFYSPTKSRRLGLGNTSSALHVSSSAQESSSNQSLTMFIINTENDSLTLEQVDAGDADIFKSTMETMQAEFDTAKGFPSSNASFSPRRPIATTSGSSPNQSAWPSQFGSSQSPQGSSSQTAGTAACGQTVGYAAVHSRTSADRTYQSKKHAESAVKTFLCWLYDKYPQENRTIQSIAPGELDKFLCSFFSNIKKPHGEEYSPKSLLAIRTGLEFHLKQQNYPASIVTSPQFILSRDAFVARKKQLEILKIMNWAQTVHSFVGQVGTCTVNKKISCTQGR